MDVCTARRWLFNLAWFSSLLALSLLGCGKKDQPQDNKGTSEVKKPDVAVQGKKNPTPPTAVMPLVPFKEAVLLDPPDGVVRPPDKTFAGKNVAQMFLQIGGKENAPGLFDQVALATPEGKPLRYTAGIKTDLGEIEVELLSEAAPNHVRNFIALARAGYYDGLLFERSSRVLDGETPAILYGGCPLGTGEVGQGSIGYWMKPELARELTHEEGTLGAWHHPDTPESAACRFYITLTKAAGMDGAYTIFGKIRRGLDVAHTINKRPNRGNDPFSDEPVEPVVIRSVTVQATVEETNVAWR